MAGVETYGLRVHLQNHYYKIRSKFQSYTVYLKTEYRTLS